jgi:UDP-N-acetylmuramoylalanine--D-glutamate ligase
MGLGRFGGGLGAARWLASQGHQVLITDRKPATDFTEPLQELAPLIDAGTITLRLGEHRTEDFTSASLVVANPAVPQPWTNPYLQAAKAAGVPITTEIGLLIDRLPKGLTTVAITGSAGKSTTSAMIFHALSAALQASSTRVYLGGNIGGSLLEHLGQIRPADIVVLELSSAMLHWLEPHRFAPSVAVWTNLSPNHQDWHASLDHYASSKATLLRFQSSTELAILGPGLNDPSAPGPATGVGAAPRAIITQGLQGPMLIPGDHNRLNAAMAAAAAAAALTRAGRPHLATPERIERLLASFPGLEHRMSLCHTDSRGRRYYNDSKSTTFAALQQALGALVEERAKLTADPFARHIHVIVGGDAKGQDLGPKVESLSCMLGGVALIGRDGPALAAACKDRPNVFLYATLDEAVAQTIPRLDNDGVLLLSPACASWDQFPNYEHRGRRFVQLVKQHAP